MKWEVWEESKKKKKKDNGDHLNRRVRGSTNKLLHRAKKNGYVQLILKNNVYFCPIFQTTAARCHPGVAQHIPVEVTLKAKRE